MFFKIMVLIDTPKEHEIHLGIFVDKVDDFGALLVIEASNLLIFIVLVPETKRATSLTLNLHVLPSWVDLILYRIIFAKSSNRINKLLEVCDCFVDGVEFSILGQIIVDSIVVEIMISSGINVASVPPTF